MKKTVFNIFLISIFTVRAYSQDIDNLNKKELRDNYIILVKQNDSTQKINSDLNKKIDSEKFKLVKLEKNNLSQLEELENKNFIFIIMEIK